MYSSRLQTAGCRHQLESSCLPQEPRPTPLNAGPLRTRSPSSVDIGGRDISSRTRISAGSGAKCRRLSRPACQSAGSPCRPWPLCSRPAGGPSISDHNARGRPAVDAGAVAVSHSTPSHRGPSAQRRSWPRAGAQSGGVPARPQAENAGHGERQRRREGEDATDD